ncbi:hypothetical protein [Streptomyces griseoruber]|uniref:JmjC domain-containing protein n=1 Tax=Streptomyces griseoruber TaxID=1943 RepID=A0A101SM84_9ACTN|nr:hypothetical protein [Streptomyces griseoruber]KUN76444.1 hypothetical protein AQJ64_38500 [Streptomyces griseoruber]
MDYEGDRGQGKSGLELFVRDLALCLSVHRDRGPALVWPDGVDAVLVDGDPTEDGHPRRGRADPEPAGVAAGTDALTSGLGELLACRVGSSYLTLDPGTQSGGNTAATDLVLLPVRGSCGGRVEPAPPGRARAVLDRPLELRLRVGEALYVPSGFGYELNEAHSPCTLLVLALHPPIW